MQVRSQPPEASTMCVGSGMIIMKGSAGINVALVSLTCNLEGIVNRPCSSMTITAISVPQHQSLRPQILPRMPVSPTFHQTTHLESLTITDLRKASFRHRDSQIRIQ